MAAMTYKAANRVTPDGLVSLDMMGFNQVKKNRENTQDRYTMNKERNPGISSPGKHMMVPVIKKISQQTQYGRSK